MYQMSLVFEKIAIFLHKMETGIGNMKKKDLI